MTKLSKIAVCLLPFVIIGLLWWHWPTQQNLCRSQISDLQQGTASERLETWAQQDVFSKTLTANDVARTRPYANSMWTFVGINVAWDKLGFDSDRNLSVRLVGPDEAWHADKDPNAYKSVLLTHMNHVAVLVKKPSGGDFGVGANAEHLHPISENVAVLCLPGRD